MVKPLLEVDNLTVRIKKSSKVILNNVSFTLDSDQSIGVVGGSGSGKTTLALAVAGLLDDDLILEGRIVYKGMEISNKPIDRNKVKIGLIFQDAATSLNPVFKIGTQIADIIANRRNIKKREALTVTKKMLKAAGIEKEEVAGLYPHQLSGGMRQRAMIVMAVAGDPEILIADEPTSNLDIVTRNKVLDLIDQYRLKSGCGAMMISHDLSLIEKTARDAVVIYDGRIVEQRPVEDLIARPRHPFSVALVESRLTIARAAELKASRNVKERYQDVGNIGTV